MSTNDKKFGLFSVFGIEIELMIVDKHNFNILPIADEIIHDLSGSINNEISLGDIAVSNELALHVIELKTDGPVRQLEGLAEKFQTVVEKINAILAPKNALLLPTGAHPWFQPTAETKLWPHGDKSIYQAFHRIFNCEGHGWTNLQSVHINLPFKNDDEFSILHNAIRLLLPFIPALTASTPYLNGKNQHCLDTRLQVYAQNQKSIPSITGFVIPEFVQSEKEYDDIIFQPMYRDIRPYDPENLLQYEWLNSRGAIARFDRNAIEIRVVDTQECPKMDLAVVELITAALKTICQQPQRYLKKPLPTELLRQQYDACLTQGLNTPLLIPDLLNQFGIEDSEIKTARDLWRTFAELHQLKNCAVILTQGNLAERILTATQGSNDAARLKQVYQELATCLQLNQEFCS